MKKKYYLMGSFGLQILLALYSILTIGNIAKEQMEELPEYLGSMSYSGAVLLEIIFLIIGIACCLYGFYVVSEDKIALKKGSLIFTSLFFALIFSDVNLIALLLAIINTIIFCCIKVDKETKEKIAESRKIPILDLKELNSIPFSGAIIVILLCFLEPIVYLFLYLFNITKLSDNMNYIIQLVLYIIKFLLAIYIYINVLKRDFKEFKNNFSKYFRFILRKIAIFYPIFVCINLLILLIGNGTSENQKLIESVPIWYSFIFAVFFAPIFEELVCRGSLRRIVKNDKAFIIISGIIFGLLHTIFSEVTIVNIFLKAIPYAFMGGYFAYCYKKTNNICTNISLHFTNNLMAFLIMLIK